MKTWIYLQNPFITATDGSYIAMKKISNFTVIALSTKLADPFFAGLHTALKPLADAYNTAYTKWQSETGQQLGSSSTLKQLLAQLRGDKIEDWDIKIQNVYKNGTSEYISLLPYHRTPFQTGSQTNLLDAVEALETAIGNDAALATVKADVVAFNTQLKAAYDAQKGKITTTGSNSTAVEAARIAVAVGLYGVLGQLMDHFKNKPEDAALYFDLETIRNHEQTVFTGSIKGGELLLALTHTFDATENVRLVNRGNTTLHFALLANPTDTIGTLFYSLAPNSQKVLLANDLGNIANRYLKVLNMSDTEAGAYTIELV